MRISRQVSVAAMIALVAVLVDQGTKAVVRQALPVCGGPAITCVRVDLLGPVGLLRTENDAAALGIAGSDLLSAALALSIGLLLIQLIVARHQRDTPIALGLLAGGAAANLIDRVAFGGVTDFIDFAFVGSRGGVVLNPADIALLLGLVLMTRAALRSLNEAAESTASPSM
jgi:signal peptidase II